MLIDFSKLIFAEDDKPLMEGETHVTLGLIARRGLNVIFKDEGQLPPAEGYKRGDLFYKLKGDPQIDLTEEERATIKTCIGNTC